MLLHFVHPVWLFALLLLPLLVLIHWQMVQRERAALEDFASASALNKMKVRPASDQRFWRGIVLIVALACGLVALAQPRWGQSGFEAADSQDGSVVLVMDVSKSMRVQDMGGESRIKAAQRILDKLVPTLAGWKVGVVGFAGEAQALVPLTSDHTAVETLLARAQPGQVPGIGSNVELGLKLVAEQFRKPGRRMAVLLTDGEELTGNAAAATAALNEAKVQLLVIGLGTPDGGQVPGAADVWGNPSFVTYRGEKVVSRLNEPLLKRLASDTGGAYARATEGRAVETLTAKLTPITAGAKLVTPAADQAAYELFQIPLALGLLLVLVDTAWGLVGRSRREQRFGDYLKHFLKRPALGMLLAAIYMTQSGWTWYPSWLPNREAGTAFQAGDFKRAESLLERALKEDPKNFRLRYNLANVQYEQKRYTEAIASYRAAWEQAEESERPLIGYNMGNAHFRQAESTKTIPGYQQAVTEYERVLAAHPDDADARYNLELAKERLKQAQKNPPKPNNSGSGQGQSGSQGNAQTSVGVGSTYKPPALPKHLPSEGEVDALLKALESDERQRQAEQGASEQAAESGNGGPYAQQLLQQALGSLDMKKDW